jgi:hypothetical protein
MVLSHLHWAILNPGFQMTSRSVQHDLKCPRSSWGFFPPVDYDGLDTPVERSPDRLFIQPCLDIMSSPVAYLSECTSQEDILWQPFFGSKYPTELRQVTWFVISSSTLRCLFLGALTWNEAHTKPLLSHIITPRGPALLYWPLWGDYVAEIKMRELLTQYCAEATAFANRLLLLECVSVYRTECTKECSS